jgi:sulfur carrier protein
MLELTVNGEIREVDSPCTVQSLLDQLALGARRVAVAINRDVIPRSSFPSHELAAGDRVEILEAVGGGA